MKGRRDANVEINLSSEDRSEIGELGCEISNYLIPGAVILAVLGSLSVSIPISLSYVMFLF